MMVDFVGFEAMKLRILGLGNQILNARPDGSCAQSIDL